MPGARMPAAPAGTPSAAAAPLSSLHEHMLAAPDGTRLFVRDELIDGAAGAAVILHGLGEHGGRHANVARFFHAHGWSTRRIDHRGHGRSEGRLGDTPDDEAIVRDAEHAIADFARITGQVPLLLGHSMGGLFAARVATGGRVPLRALVLSSPALAVRLSAFERFLQRTMRRLAPAVTVGNGL